jgi:transcription antitermination factor NusG
MHDTDPFWYAVFTKSRCEKVVQKMLLAKKVETFLPINHYTRKYARKIKQIEKPLINGYVFVRIIKEEYVKVLETEHVVSFLKFGKDIISIPDDEINILRQIVGEDIELNIETKSLKVGDTVEIIKGNLYGMKGTLQSMDGKNRINISLETLGFDIVFNIDTKSVSLV